MTVALLGRRSRRAQRPNYAVWTLLTSRSEVVRRHKPSNLAKSVTVE